MIAHLNNLNYLLLTILMQVLLLISSNSFAQDDFFDDENMELMEMMEIKSPYSSICSNDYKIDRFSIDDIINTDTMFDLVAEGKYQEVIWYLRSFEPQDLQNGTKEELQILIDSYQNALEQTLKATDVYNGVKNAGSGVTGARFVQLVDNVSGVFKTDEGGLGADSDAEVAAYKLDELLQLNIVPRTEKVIFEGKVGSMQYLVSSKKEKYVTMSEAPRELRERVMKNDEIKKLRFLDFLMENYDRHEGNYLVGSESGKLVAIDNGWGFPGQRAYKRWPHKKALSFIKRGLSLEESIREVLPPKDVYERLKSIDALRIRSVLSDLKRKGEIEGEKLIQNVLERIDLFKGFFKDPEMEKKYYGNSIQRNSSNFIRPQY